MIIRNKKNAFFLLLLILFVFLMFGGLEWLHWLKREPNSPTLTTTLAETEIGSFPRKFRDAVGNTLIIPSPPQRIVSQTLGTDEILLAICPLERIVAVSSVAKDAKYSNVVEKAQLIAGQASSHVEQILSFQPDLIFVASYSSAEMVKLLQTTGAPVFLFAHFQNVTDIKNNIKTIGYAIGEEQRAVALLTQMETDIQTIRARIPKNRASPRVLLYSQWGYTAGANTIFNDMLRIVNAINIATEQGIEGHVKISTEQIMKWQPEVIVTGAIPGKFEEVRQFLLKNQAIATSQAGKMGRILMIDIRYLNTVSQYIVYGIKALAAGLYTDSTTN